MMAMEEVWILRSGMNHFVQKYQPFQVAVIYRKGETNPIIKRLELHSNFVISLISRINGLIMCVGIRQEILKMESLKARNWILII
jgi:molybdate-binding protein